MSIRTMTRVWDHADAEGGALLALLALADFADDEGYCWPKVSEIASKARLSERGTYDVLTSLEVAGEIARFAGGGRGRAATYAILSGLSADERAKRVQGLQGKSEQRMQKMQGLRAKRVQPSQGLQHKTLNAAQKNPANGRTGTAPDTGVLTPKNEAGATLIRHVDPSCSETPPSPLPPEQPAAVVVVESPTASDFPERPTEQPGSRAAGQNTAEPDQPSSPSPPVAAAPSPPGAGPGRVISFAARVAEASRHAPADLPGAALLSGQGFYPAICREFGGYAPELLAAEIALFRGAGRGEGAIVSHWRIFPPGTMTAEQKEALSAAHNPRRSEDPLARERASVAATDAYLADVRRQREAPRPARETVGEARARRAREAAESPPDAAPDAQ